MLMRKSKTMMMWVCRKWSMMYSKNMLMRKSKNMPMNILKKTLMSISKGKWVADLSACCVKTVNVN